MSLEEIGWNIELQLAFERLDDARGSAPARVVRRDKLGYRVVAESGDAPARLSGRLRALARAGDAPTVGDWVAVDAAHGDPTTIRAVLPRRTRFARKAAGTVAEREQLIAANVDVAFIVLALDEGVNARRAERYLVVARESGARPVLVLNKSDAAGDLEASLAAARAIAGEAPVLAASGATGEGVAAIRALVPRGTTAAFLGMSGAGKSTLVNALLGRDALRTAAVRERDARGRHTTTHRELLAIPGGGALIDTPGMRELGLLDAVTGVAATFADVGALAGSCRFRDCAHATEPGCAVQAAIAEGALDPERLASYQKLAKEAARVAKRGTPAGKDRSAERAWGRHARATIEGKRRRRADEW